MEITKESRVEYRTNYTNAQLDALIEKKVGTKLPTSLRNMGTNKQQKIDLYLFLSELIRNGGECQC
jgi:hypothetical protein